MYLLNETRDVTTQSFPISFSLSKNEKTNPFLHKGSMTSDSCLIGLLQIPS